LLVDLYAAATSAVAPGPALAARLDDLDLDPDLRIWILALGKAALPMAEAALQSLRRRDLQPAGGLIVAPAPGRSPHPQLTYVQGDHPEPGPGSLAAAEAVGAMAARVEAGDEVWVLLSGGTTSLVGAPEPGLASHELTAIYRLLLGSGLDITAMNRIRKRFTRWGGGKLARALVPAQVKVYIVSDVIGDDLPSIGSGPCVPDPTTAAEVRALLDGAGLWRRIPESARTLVTSAAAGTIAETLKAGDPAFAQVALELIASNRLALEAAAKRAAELGLVPAIMDAAISGEASAVGATLAIHLLDQSASHRTSQSKGLALIWGGETTVSLGDNGAGLGGRCQELALAAARVMENAPDGLALLAAGTDGRDGPTDAAGAIVDGKTWATITANGRDPARDLAGHDAYHALDAAGALLRPGLTGTNVMDIVIGICEGKSVSGTRTSVSGQRDKQKRAGRQNVSGKGKRKP
jgi:glycerate 2-kinase